MTADEARKRAEAKLKAVRVREAGDLLKTINAEALLGRRQARFLPAEVTGAQAEALRGLGYEVWSVSAQNPSEDFWRVVW